MSDASVEQILKQIQYYLDARPYTRPSDDASQGRGARFSVAVYDALDEANAVIDVIHVKPFLTPSRLPVVGDLWRRVRTAAHNLVVYYVNCLAGAQGVFNRQLVIALTTLVSDLDRDGRVDLADEVVMLRQEIAELRSRVVALQTASDSPDCNHEAPR